MITAIKSSVRVLKAALLSFPLLTITLAAEADHSAHSNHLLHWGLTIILVVVLGWIIYKAVGRYRNK